MYKILTYILGSQVEGCKDLTFDMFSFLRHVLGEWQFNFRGWQLKKEGSGGEIKSELAIKN